MMMWKEHVNVSIEFVLYFIHTTNDYNV
jgi:hypothetical protein